MIASPSASPTRCSAIVATAKPARYSSAVAAADLGPVGMAVKQTEYRPAPQPGHAGSRTASATSSPRISTEARISGSTAGSGTPAIAAPNPSAIAPTKPTGKSHSARPDRNAAHSPTASIAST